MFWNKVSEQSFVKERQLEQHLLSAKTIIEQEDFYKNYLNNEFRQIINEDSLSIELSQWGAYAIAKCKAFNGKLSLSRNYLYGGEQAKDTTLCLIDNKNPLV